MGKMVREEHGSRFKGVFKRAILNSRCVLRDEGAYAALKDAEPSAMAVCVMDVQLPIDEQMTISEVCENKKVPLISILASDFERLEMEGTRVIIVSKFDEEDEDQ